VKDLEVIPGAGHCPHDEAPELVNPILRRWILSAPE
jgi:pimeloyl-ACP methyl ester carboxylesterase